MYQRQICATAIGLMATFGRKMACYTLNILHQGNWMFKYVMVDVLKDVADWSATLVEFGTIGIINMPAAIGSRSDELTINAKCTENRAQSNLRVRALHLTELPGAITEARR
jgi:hypothetical protein